MSKFIVIIRPEFMTFCKDGCRAAALNHLLFRLAGKSKGQPKERIQAGEILWYAKNEVITAEMANAWGVCKVGQEVNALVSMGLFGRKNNPHFRVDRTKHFCFGSDQCAVFLNFCEKNGVCVVHLDLPPEVKHLIYSSNANDRSIKCSCPEPAKAEANDKSIECISGNHQMQMMNPSDAFDRSIETIYKEDSKNLSKESLQREGYVVAGANAQQQPTPVFEPFEPSDPIEPEQEEPLLIANGGTTTVPFPVLPETPRTFRLSSAHPQAPVVSHGRAPQSIRLISSGGVVQDSLLPPGGDEQESDLPGAGGYKKPPRENAGNGEQANDAAPPETGNGGRARKKQVSTAEINQYQELFDKLGRETTYQDASGVTLTVMPNGYGHTGVDRDHIKALLRNNLRDDAPDFVNPAKLTAVYRRMASLPPEDGYHWAAKGMSIKSVCNNYSRFANDLIQASRRRQQPPPTPAAPPTERRPIRYVGTPNKPTRPRVATS